MRKRYNLAQWIISFARKESRSTTLLPSQSVFQDPSKFSVPIKSIKGGIVYRVWLHIIRGRRAGKFPLEVHDQNMGRRVTVASRSQRGRTELNTLTWSMRVHRTHIRICSDYFLLLVSFHSRTPSPTPLPLSRFSFSRYLSPSLDSSSSSWQHPNG